MSIIYGPVPSWRFGRSLGIDAISKPKTCSFNCVYCQLGKTQIYIPKPTTLSSKVTPSIVEKELEKALMNIDVETIDVVTISGLGEPTLNLWLKDIAKTVKSKINKPLVILTNSSTIHLAKVKETLMEFDIVCAKLDAGNNESFKIINRPHPEVPRIEDIVNELKKFNKQYNGTLALQIMLIRLKNGFSNASKPLIDNIVNYARITEPKIIQLSTPYRPPQESYVESLTVEELKRVAELFLQYFPKTSIWVYGIHDLSKRKVKYKEIKDLESKVMDLLSRRPCTLTDIHNVFSTISENVLKQTITSLINKGKVRRILRNGREYFMAKTS